MVLTYRSILSCFLVTGSFHRGKYVEKPVLSMGANMLTPSIVLQDIYSKALLVCNGTIYVRLHYPVLCMAKHKL
jgi:hypothetical protein